jgi:hypothetical protein
VSDNSYNYFTQMDFTGGLATEPELRRVGKGGEVTVIEAADVWAPNGVLTRRPGVVGSITNFAPGVLVTPSDPIDTTFLVVGTTKTNFANDGSGNWKLALANGVKGVVYIPISGLNSGYASGIVYTGYAMGANPPTLTRASAIWTPTGSYLDAQQIDCYTSAGTVSVGASAESVSKGQIFAKYELTGGVSGFVNLEVANNGLAYGVDNLEDDLSAFGATYSALPSGGKYLCLDAAGAQFSLQFYATTSTASAPRTTNIQVATQPGTSPYGAPPSWATVPDANRTYVAYANQVYEYRPEYDFTGASQNPFRVAQVNSAPEVTGSIEGTPSPYSPTFVAQFQSFPQANQVIYFNGLLFMTDIKGVPNALQWGGPALAGAVDVLPVLSYALLSDSRDNSQNVGFGVYNQNLYVFKRNSVWSVVPSGQSTVDGSYLFTTKLVTSGAGCSAASSIVSTPNGIIFYNPGGFYIFDGVRTQKLTQSLKHVIDAINPGAAYQMSAAHWVTQHSYVVTLQMSPPWHSTTTVGLPGNFRAALEYDYQNNSWWLWLSVAGKSFYVDGLNQLISQIYYNEFRTLDPNKQYDSDVLAKSSATPYFKTQRFGFGESIQHNYGEVRIRGEIDSLSYALTQTPNDQILANSDLAMTLSMLPPNYAIIGQNTLIPDGSPYSPPWGRREAFKNLNNSNMWTQLSVAGSYGPFTVYGLEMGYMQEGRDG